MFIHTRIYTLLENPNLATIMAHSAYSLDEVKATLACAEEVGKEYATLVEHAGKLIDPNPFLWGESEIELHKWMSGDPCISTGKTNEPFPVRSWQQAIARQRTHNRLFKKAIKEFETCQPNP